MLLVLINFARPCQATLSVNGLELKEAADQDFFRFFQFKLMGYSLTRDGYTMAVFRPGKEMPYRLSVNLFVTLDGQNRIKRMRINLDRRFIDDSQLGMFARDVAKSFVQAAVPEKDYDDARAVANEIFFRQPLTRVTTARAGGKILSVFKIGTGELAPGDIIIIGESSKLPVMPGERSEFYACYEGSRRTYQKDFGDTMLRFSNRESAGQKYLEITVMPTGDRTELRSTAFDFHRLPLRAPR